MNEDEFKQGLRLILCVSVGILCIIMLWYAGKQAGCGTLMK